MATYKVIQDIEAEDKLVGPLSLRQFIYAAIAVISAFLAYKFAAISIFLIIPFAPVVILFGVLAAPFGHDQPNEVWLLARIRFYLLPHKRVWNQSGMINLVTITVPKKIQRNLTKNLTESEVTGRLQALANTIDSRGWAIKNVNVNLTNQAPDTQIPEVSDRLIDPMTLPQDVPATDVTAADDIMDAANNPTAQHLDQMMVNATQQHHQQIVNNMSSPQSQTAASPGNTPDYWFMNNNPTQAPIPEGYAKFSDDQVIAPGSDETLFSPTTDANEDELLLEQIEHNKKVQPNMNGHMHILNPLNGNMDSMNPATLPAATNPFPAEPSTNTNPAIINQALANSDNWSVATQARQAEKAQDQLPPQDEVTISLH